MARVIDMTGKQFGEWTVLKRAGSDKRGQALWDCQCSWWHNQISCWLDFKEWNKSTLRCKIEKFKRE